MSKPIKVVDVVIVVVAFVKKKIGPKSFWSKNNLGQEESRQKNLTRKFWITKSLGTNKCFGQKIFGSKKSKMFGTKTFWSKKYLGQKKFCPKKMLVHIN